MWVMITTTKGTIIHRMLPTLHHKPHPQTTPYSYLDGPVSRAGGKPLIARLHGNTPDPTQVATDHPHQLPGRVPLWLDRHEGLTLHQLLCALTQHQCLCSVDKERLPLWWALNKTCESFSCTCMLKKRDSLQVVNRARESPEVTYL